MATSEITVIQGWNWYVGADPAQIGQGQYDFQSTLTHELGHALGLGHSADSNSTMFWSLTTGMDHRTMTVADLNIPDPDGGAKPDPLMAAGFHFEAAVARSAGQTENNLERGSHLGLDLGGVFGGALFHWNQRSFSPLALSPPNYPISSP